MALSFPETQSGPIRAGRAYWASTPSIALAVAGQFDIVLKNPSGSGKRLIVTDFLGTTSLTALSWIDVYYKTGAFTTEPTTAAQIINLIPSNGNTSVAQILYDARSAVATKTTGGTKIGTTALSLTGRMPNDAGHFHLMPNDSISLRIPAAVALSGNFECFFYEEAV